MKRIVTIVFLILTVWAEAQTGYLVQPAKWKFTRPQWLDSGAWIKNISKYGGQQRVLVYDSVTNKIGYKYISSGTTYTAGRGLTLNSNAFILDTATVSNLAYISANSTTTANSIYQMTPTIPVHFKSSDANTLLYLDETNERVGIGTTSPVSSLHVGVAPTASANYGLVSLGSGAFDGSTSGFFTGSAYGTGLAMNMASGYAGDLANFQVAGATKFRVINTGVYSNNYFISPSQQTWIKEINDGQIQYSGKGFTGTVHNFRDGYSLQSTSGTAIFATFDETFGAGAGSALYKHMNFTYTINNSGAQSGTATGIFLNATETSLNGMTHNLMNLQVGGSSKVKADNSGNFTVAKYFVSALNTAPSSANDTGTLGEIRITTNYIYVCINTNVWVRTQLSTW